MARYRADALHFPAINRWKLYFANRDFSLDSPPRPNSFQSKETIMNRNPLLLVGLLALALTASGCRAGGTQSLGQAFGQPQLGSQIFQEAQQPIFKGSTPQLGGNLPTAQQAQQAFGQLGRNIGSRITNGVLNHGVSQLLNTVL